MKKFVWILAAVLLAAALLTGCGKATTKLAALEGTFDRAAALDEKGFFKGIRAADYVELPEYKGITIPDSVVTADPKALQEQLDNIRQNFATYETILDRAVEDGDTVNIDYVGKIDGVEFENGSTQGQGTDVTIGVTSYIDDFLEQVIGHKPGETFDIEVTFPDPYQLDETKSGKDAVFTVTVNSIRGEETVPELNEEMAAEYGFDSIDALKADIANWLIATQKEDFITDLLDSATVKKALPQTVIDYAANTQLEQYKTYAEYYSMTLEEMITTVLGAESVEAFLADSQADFEQAALYFMTVQAIAEKEGLTVTDADIEAAGLTGYVEAYSRNYVCLATLQKTVVMNFILENAAK